MYAVPGNLRLCTRRVRSNAYLKASLNSMRRLSVLMRGCSSKSFIDSVQPNMPQTFGKTSDLIKASGKISDPQIFKIISDLEAGFSKCSSQEFVKSVEVVWNEIENSGITLTTSHYNALLKLYFKTKVDFEPLDFLIHMQDNNIEINEETFTEIINQLVLKHEPKLFTPILNFMLSEKVLITENCIFSLLDQFTKTGDVVNANISIDILNRLLYKNPESCARLICEKNEAFFDLVIKCSKFDISVASNLLHVILHQLDLKVSCQIAKELKNNFSHCEALDVFRNFIEKDSSLDLVICLQSALQFINNQEIINLYIELKKHPDVVLSVVEELGNRNHENVQEITAFALKSSVTFQYHDLTIKLLNKCEMEDISTTFLNQGSISRLADVTGLLKSYTKTKCCKLDAILSAFSNCISLENPKVILLALGSVYDSSSACKISEFFINQGDFSSARKYIQYCGIHAPALGMKAALSLNDHQFVTINKITEFTDFIFASAVQLLWYDELIEKLFSNFNLCENDALSATSASSNFQSKCGFSFRSGREYFGDILTLIGENTSEENLLFFVDEFAKRGLGIPTTTGSALKLSCSSKLSRCLGPLSKVSMANLCIPFRSEVLNCEEFCEVNRLQWLQENLPKHIFSLSELSDILKGLAFEDFQMLVLPPQFELVVRLQYVLSSKLSLPLKTNFSWTSEDEKCIFILAMCQLMARDIKPSTVEVLMLLPNLESHGLRPFISSYLMACKTTKLFRNSIKVIGEKLSPEDKTSIWWKIVRNDFKEAVEESISTLKTTGTSKHLVMLTAALHNHLSFSALDLLEQLFSACYEALVNFNEYESLTKLLTISILHKNFNFVKAKFSILKSYPNAINSILNECSLYGENVLKNAAHHMLSCSPEYGATAYSFLLEFYCSMGRNEEAKSLVMFSGKKNLMLNTCFQQAVLKNFGGALQLYNRIELLLEKNLTKEATAQLSSVPLTQSFCMRLMMCCFLGGNTKTYNFLKNRCASAHKYYSDAINMKLGNEQLVVDKLQAIANKKRQLETSNTGLVYAVASFLKMGHKDIDAIIQTALSQKSLLALQLLWKAQICVGNECAAKEIETVLEKWQYPISKSSANFASYTFIVAESMNIEELETHMYFLEKQNCAMALKRATAVYLLALVANNESTKLLALSQSLQKLPVGTINQLSHNLVLGERTKYKAEEYLSSVVDDYIHWEK